MKQAVILGNPDSKRGIYFQKAAKEEGLPVLFIDWKEWKERKNQFLSKPLFLKIDPPLWKNDSLDKFPNLIDDYIEQLKELSYLSMQYKVEFFNSPLEIIELLDKCACKEKLFQAGLSVTERLEKKEIEEVEIAEKAKEEKSEEIKKIEEIRKPDKEKLVAEKFTLEQLFELMKEKKIYQVFIKPVKGSGAAGVSAFRWQPDAGKMVLYTCALWREDIGLVNTKRLRCFRSKEEVSFLLNQIFKLDCIVERWYAKAEYQGFSYDLRAVVQENKVDFLLGRLSKGPITNLHLNNKPLEVSALGLPMQVKDEIEDLCRRSMKCYPGLRSAGIDLLLEKDSLKPRIIEMNAQGDLIYQDIYQENKIYHHQVKIIKDWLKS